MIDMIEQIASEVDRLCPSQVDGTLAGNTCQEAGHNGHPGDETRWPTVGWYCEGGNAGHPVFRIHPDDQQTLLDRLVSLPDGAIDAMQEELRPFGALREMEVFRGIRIEWCV